MTTPLPDIEDLVHSGRHDVAVHKLSSHDVAAIRGALLPWYRQRKRDLPWRRPGTTPYGTWVSEVMCQQTRVEAVIPHYDAWMTAFPTVQALAAATDEETRALWAGLGFYRRCALLVKGARQVVSDFGGALPADTAGLLAVPGIGRYTAGAIASIAFGAAVPVVDGNVVRVLSRLRLVAADAKSKRLDAWCWQVATELVPSDGSVAGDWNQALMELGATVCVPGAPKCDQCPLSAHCLSFGAVRRSSGVRGTPFDKAKRGEGSSSACIGVIDLTASDDDDDGEEKEEDRGGKPAASTVIATPCDVCEPHRLAAVSLGEFKASCAQMLPLKAVKAAPRQERLVACVVVRGGVEVFMVKRPAKGLLAGQWEPLNVVVQSRKGGDDTDGDDDSDVVVEGGDAKTPSGPVTAAALVHSKCGVRVAVDGLGVVSCGTVTHIFSHIHHTIDVYLCEVGSGGGGSGGAVTDGRWFPVSDLATAGLSTWACKVIAAAVPSSGLSSYVHSRASGKDKKTTVAEAAMGAKASPKKRPKRE